MMVLLHLWVYKEIIKKKVKKFLFRLGLDGWANQTTQTKFLIQSNTSYSSLV